MLQENPQAGNNSPTLQSLGAVGEGDQEWAPPAALGALKLLFSPWEEEQQLLALSTCLGIAKENSAAPRQGLAIPRFLHSFSSRQEPGGLCCSSPSGDP